MGQCVVSHHTVPLPVPLTAPAFVTLMRLEYPVKMLVVKTKSFVGKREYVKHYSFELNTVLG